MKTFFTILLSFFILSASASFAGTFFEPEKEKPKEKAKIAAAQLNESFSYFYKMLEYIERENIGSAEEKKNAFLWLLKKSSASFDQVVNEVTDAEIKIQPQTKEQEKAWIFIHEEYFKGKAITEKELAKLAVVKIDELHKIFEKFQISPEQPDFFSNLRKLIIEALRIQRTGIAVSDIWEAIIP